MDNPFTANRRRQAGTTPAPSRPAMFQSRLLSASEQTARLTQCEACEKNVNGNCTLCRTCGGRPIIHKVRLDTETCPLNRWPRQSSLIKNTLGKPSSDLLKPKSAEPTQTMIHTGGAGL